MDAFLGSVPIAGTFPFWTHKSLCFETYPAGKIGLYPLQGHYPQISLAQIRSCLQARAFLFTSRYIYGRIMTCCAGQHLTDDVLTPSGRLHILLMRHTRSRVQRQAMLEKDGCGDGACLGT